MILDRYLVKQFIPIFFVAVVMFMLLLSLIDLFANLWRYLNYEVPVKEILTVSYFYLPKSFSYAMPISLLFASAYTLGDLYARNELNTIFASGIPFWRFSVPLIVIGFLAAFFSFFFDDRMVIPTLKKKNDLQRILLHQQSAENNSDIVIKARNGELIYSVDYFDPVNRTLNGVSIIEIDDKGMPKYHLRAPRASWYEGRWVFSSPIIYEWKNGLLLPRYGPPAVDYKEEPEIFRRNLVNVEDLSARDAGLLVKDLKTAGLPYMEALSEYYHRFSFPTASLVVMILSISMGGRFRKNILLMSLLASLGSAVVFYVMEMISMMMGKLGYVPPITGAWFPVISFIAIGILLLLKAKT
ncbi:MAG: LptF/LptG family permease [Treponema sp.]|jgi:lipopolysaccharide export system permease protein|nr:LptF/LptG family permease [Treponema sp.]